MSISTLLEKLITKKYYEDKAEIQNNMGNTSGIYKFLICFVIILITTFLVKKLSEGRKK